MWHLRFTNISAKRRTFNCFSTGQCYLWTWSWTEICSSFSNLRQGQNKAITQVSIWDVRLELAGAFSAHAQWLMQTIGLICAQMNDISMKLPPTFTITYLLRKINNNLLEHAQKQIHRPITTNGKLTLVHFFKTLKRSNNFTTSLLIPKKAFPT